VTLGGEVLDVHLGEDQVSFLQHRNGLQRLADAPRVRGLTLIFATPRPTQLAIL
jgi:hypothetical protein